MTTPIAEDFSAIRARLEEIERAKGRHQAPALSAPASPPWAMPDGDRETRPFGEDLED